MFTVTISGNGKIVTREAKTVVYHQGGQPPNTAGLPDEKPYVSIHSDNEPTEIVDKGKVFVMNDKGATVAVHDVIQLT
jgi:hypothetical protein